MNTTHLFRATRPFAGALVLLSWLMIPVARADVDFVPTADQWATWPPYCRARYTNLYSRLLEDKDMANQVSAQEIEHWNNVLGVTFGSVHHYCFALVEYQKALVDSNNQDRLFHLGEAASDVKFTFDRLEASDQLAPEVTTLYAQIENELGHTERAETLLTGILRARPEADGPYLVLSSIKRKQGKANEAIAILEKGNRLTEFKSAEINYSLGLMYVDTRDFVAARECASRAYALGYPLPGLRNKLNRAGQ